MSAPVPGRALLRDLKAAAGPKRAALVLPIGSPAQAYLRPVGTRAGRILDEDVGHLTTWRNANVSAFLSEFVATDERTRRWLTDLVAIDDGRILFMIDDSDGTTVGYIGMAFIDWERGSGEADAVVRGRPGPPGLMRTAMQTMFDWARTQLGLSQLGVRVRSDNPAVRFYERFGFVETRRVPLEAVEEPGARRWIETATAGPDAPSLVYMTLGNGPGK